MRRALLMQLMDGLQIGIKGGNSLGQSRDQNQEFWPSSHVRHGKKEQPTQKK